MVIGGGISGMQAALNLANQGVKVKLIERSASIGGLMPQLDKTFPTLDCAMCILSPFMVDTSRHPNIDIITLAEVTRVEKKDGGYKVDVVQHPRFVDLDKCTGCGVCEEKCPKKQPSEFNSGLGTRKVIYFQFPQAVPLAPRIDKENCTYFKNGKCKVCEMFCEAEAVDFEQEDSHLSFDVGSIVVATGAEPFDPCAREEYGFGRYDNVYTSLQLERMLSASGPYMGQVRLSDGKAPRSVAFINCVGSRDHRVGQEYCSKICCMYGMKEALLVKEHEPETDVTIFYMDIRASGKGYEEFYRKLRYDEKLVNFIRARPAEIIENADKTLIVKYEDTLEGKIKEKNVDMVVLNMAMVAGKGTGELAKTLGVQTDKWGFMQIPKLSEEPLDSSSAGIYVCGMAQGPADITDSTYRGIGASSRAAGNTKGERSFPVPPEYPELKESDVRTGVFVCHCGKNIASVIDIEKMNEYAKTLPGVVHVEDNIFACSENGQTRICDSIKEHGLTRVVVAACSPRTHEATFQDALREAGLNPFLLDMANIRNHCSWVHPDKPTALDKAKDLVRMSVARVANLSPLSRTTVGVTPVAVVIGGGIAGLASAKEFVENGFGTVYPQEESATSILARFTDELSKSQLFHLHTSTNVDNVDGYIGNFVLTAESNEYVSDKCDNCGECEKVCPVSVPDDFEEGLRERKAIYYRSVFPGRYFIDHEACTKCGECVKVCKPGAIDLTPRQFDLEFGAMVVATGYEMGDREELARWGHKKSPAVITTPELERLLDPNGPTEGKLDKAAQNPKSIGVLLCADMRWGRNGHCSRYCCSVGLKSARELKKKYPDANVYVLYESMRTTWIQELLYEDVQKMGVGFIAYSFDDLPEVEVKDRPRIVVKEALMNFKLGIPLDLLVLSVGGRPRSDSAELARTLRISCSQEGFLQEAHVKLAPVDTNNNGIFIAGCAQFPKDITDSVAQGEAAAARAMNVISREFIEVGGVVAHVDPDRCAACLTCVRNCPYDAIFINDEGLAEVNMAKCHSCGICTGECPAKAIVLRNFEDQQIIPMVDVFVRGEVDG
jgi:heterodisulfide reductase subunit A